MPRMRLKDVKSKPGSSAEIVCLAMREERLPNADPRDYVVLNGCALLTVFGEYRVTSRLDGRNVDPRNVLGDGAVEAGRERTVVHRRNLWRFVGIEEARKFWRYGHRTRK
jgi:hypothetical protein